MQRRGPGIVSAQPVDVDRSVSEPTFCEHEPPVMVHISVEAAGALGKLLGRSPEPIGGRPTAAEGGGPQAVAVSVPEGTTVEGLVRVLAELYPAFGTIACNAGRLTDAFQIVIGDRLLELAGGRERVLVENDTVVLLPPFEGG